ncbi:MAG: hypothetical protein NT099_04125 [Candidatus Saganbacteria bacterium]|nr:hypothetical protein [Candidatus Saganbacteria bacterium]
MYKALFLIFMTIGIILSSFTPSMAVPVGIGINLNTETLAWGEITLGDEKRVCLDFVSFSSSTPNETGYYYRLSYKQLMDAVRYWGVGYGEIGGSGGYAAINLSPIITAYREKNITAFLGMEIPIASKSFRWNVEGGAVYAFSQEYVGSNKRSNSRIFLATGLGWYGNIF